MRRESVPIRVVFFDVGNVLLRIDTRLVALRMAWELRRHPLRMMRYLAKTLSTVDGVERGTIGARELYGIFRAELGFEGSFARFRDFWCDHFTLDRAAFALLRRVARTRRVYLLSNTNRLHFEHIRRRYAFTREVHGAVLSYEHGARKPEPAIYDAALRVAGARPEECLFIDDRPENVEAARRRGLRAIRYTRSEDLHEALETLGLLEERSPAEAAA